MESHEDFRDRPAGSTSSSDSGIMTDIQSTIDNDYQNKITTIDIPLKSIDNHLNTIYEPNSNTIRIEDLDDVSNNNSPIDNRSNNSISSNNISINSINHNDLEHHNDSDSSTVYDSDSDFVEELGEQIGKNYGGTISKRNQNGQDVFGINESLLENGRVVLDQQIVSQTDNLGVPNLGNSVNINSLSFSGENTGVSIGPKIICHDLVIKQYVQKSPKITRRTDNNGCDNPNFINDENSSKTTYQKNDGIDDINTEKPKKFKFNSRSTIITGSIVLVIIVFCAITIVTLEVLKKPTATSNEIDYDPSLKIIEKSEWLGIPATSVLDDISLPVPKVIICHTVSEACNDQESCSQLVRSIQLYHMVNMPPPRFDEIGYNFLVGGDGAIYVGRGWRKIGAHTRTQNSKSMGIAFIGNYQDIKPTAKQLNATQMLLADGVKNNMLKSDYKLFGAKQFIPTESPGQHLYEAISKWPHFSVETIDQF